MSKLENCSEVTTATVHYLHPPAAATQYCAGGCVTRDTPLSSPPQHLYQTVSMDIAGKQSIYIIWCSFISFFQLNNFIVRCWVK